ncbi:DMT family transporter [Amphritea sp. 1_MG-2023]|uniref:DMT family transporter n=1 Tax=Amphritea sp. 1_MG-2023 TaxID=3062670 RepID=UPI0026E44565|nr:DMT family transporter [Amphritea sp. 1_MG-2023]MDO6564545.1 DMT family transporter [Amphritea sp. 1_MG-2023]
MEHLNTLNRHLKIDSLPQLSATTKAMLVLFVAIIIWGGNWPVMKAGLDHITPLWFSMIRFALGAATLFAFQISTKKLYIPRRSDLPLILSIGLVQMMIFTALGAMAMTQVAAGRSAVLAYTTPLWVLPLSIILFHETPSKQQIIATLLGLSGVIALFNPFSFDWHNSSLLFANGMLLLAAFCWSICILHLRHTRSKATAFQLAPWQMLIATLPLIVLAYAFEGPFTGNGSLAFWQICLYLGPLATAFCFCAVNDASRVLAGATMSTAILGVPVIGLLFSTWFLNEPLTLSLISGTALISGGIFFLIMSANRRDTQS